MQRDVIESNEIPEDGGQADSTRRIEKARNREPVSPFDSHSQSSREQEALSRSAFLRYPFPALAVFYFNGYFILKYFTAT